jgi:electron transfer flavoprotein beta subunit
MKIVVCLSVVPDTTSKINFTENNTKLEESGITYIINPFD